MKRKEYEAEMRDLQAELCKLQDWVKYKGFESSSFLKVVTPQAKGGTIRAITERVSPRVFRLVALPGPSDREKSPDVHSALYATFPGGRRNRNFRSQLVQPGRCGTCDGFALTNSTKHS